MITHIFPSSTEAHSNCGCVRVRACVFDFDFEREKIDKFVIYFFCLICRVYLLELAIPNRTPTHLRKRSERKNRRGRNKENEEFVLVWSGWLGFIRVVQISSGFGRGRSWKTTSVANSGIPSIYERKKINISTVTICLGQQNFYGRKCHWKWRILVESFKFAGIFKNVDLVSFWFLFDFCWFEERNYPVLEYTPAVHGELVLK